MAKVEHGMYKGKRVMAIKDGERILVSFGEKKAQAIIDHVEEIKAFMNTKTTSEA